MDATEQVEEKKSIARIHDDLIYEPPKKLVIPPNALEVVLDSFEGPLDLLLYIIRKERLDIVNLPIFEVTEQYMEYVDLMLDRDIDSASDYLVMAAILTDIKSRMLLPVIADEVEDEEDPSARLLEGLLEYAKYRNAAHKISEMPRMDRDFHSVTVMVHESCEVSSEPASIDPNDLAMALRSVLNRAKHAADHTIEKEELSIKDRMTWIVRRLEKADGLVRFDEFFKPSEGKAGIVVAFLAILELAKEKFLSFTQSEQFGVIHVTKTNADGLDVARLLL